jgi:hypothetical protein
MDEWMPVVSDTFMPRQKAIIGRHPLQGPKDNKYRCFTRKQNIELKACIHGG